MIRDAVWECSMWGLGEVECVLGKLFDGVIDAVHCGWDRSWSHMWVWELVMFGEDH